MRKWLALLVPVVLLMTAGPRLVADGAVNLAYLDMLPHLAQVLPTFELPECEERADVSAARWLLAWGMAREPAQQQGMLLANGWAAWLEGERSEAEVSWEQGCAEESPPQEVLSCLQIVLITQGAMGGVPETGLPQVLLSLYADKFGRWAELAGVEEVARFGYGFSLDLGPNRHAAGQLANTLRQEQEVEQAVRVWEGMAASLPPEDPNHWLAQGQAAELEQDWLRAANAYEHGARLAGGGYELSLREGRARQRSRDWKRAAQAFWRALLLDNTHLSVHSNLGNLYLLQGKLDQASRWISMALQINPADPSSNYCAAQVLHRLGEEGPAAMFLARAVELHTRQPWYWAVELGDWRLEQGDREGALDAYRQALSWQPGEASIEERIEQVTEN